MTYRPLTGQLSTRLTAGPSLVFPLQELELLATGPIPGLQAGAGLSYSLSDRLRLSFDAVYQSTLGRTFPYYEPESDTYNDAGKRRLQSVQYRLGIGCRI